jgi:hypothetical protein
VRREGLVDLQSSKMPWVIIKGKYRNQIRGRVENGISKQIAGKRILPITEPDLYFGRE